LNKLLRLPLAAGLFAATLVTALPAKGQENDAGYAADNRLEEIVVTSRKREESLQSVPISISAFNADQIIERNILDLKGLTNQTPAMDFQTTGALTANRVTIRGMSQLTRGLDEVNVASFIDGVYTPGFSGTETFNADALERIEVVKGPQSALYGRNSFAGAINYITKKPSYENEFGGRLTAGTDDRRGIYGYFSAPLVADSLALRLDAAHNETGSTFDNSINGKKLGSVESKYARLGLLWDVTESFEALLSVTVQNDFQTASPVTQITDDDPRRVGTLIFCNPYQAGAGGGNCLGQLFDGEIKDVADSFSADPNAYGGDRDTFRGSLNLQWDFNSFSLVSLTGYQQRKLTTLSDFNTCRPERRSAICDTIDPDGFGTYYNGPLLNAPLIANTLVGFREDRDEFSQDLRIQSRNEDWLSWSAGMYFSNEDFTDVSTRMSDTDLTTSSGAIVAIAGPLMDDSTTLINNKFYSLYGSLGFDFLSSWNFSMEGRYTREEKSANQTENNFPDNKPPTGYQAKDFTFFTPRFILSWTPADDLLVYASAAKGVKSGGFNPGAEPERSTYEPEKNWTYELGSKYTFWGGRAIMSGAVYFIDWTDQQVVGRSAVDSTVSLITNVAETEIKGFEIDGTYLLLDWLTWNIGYAFNDAEYKKGNVSTMFGFSDCAEIGLDCNGPLGTSSGDISGKTVIGQSRHALVTGLGLNIPVGNSDWAVTGRADYSYRSKQYIDEANVGYIGDRNNLNLRAGVRNANWTIEGYCNNATGDDTPTYALPPRDLFGVPHYFVVNRNDRMCGMQFSYAH